MNPIRTVLATNLTVWWVRLSPQEKFFLILLGLLAAIAIPLSISAANQPTNTTVGAQVSYPSQRTNRAPTISNQEFHCRVDKPCTFTIKAVDPDITDELFMELDFLPATINLTNCDLKSTLTRNLGISCTVEGIPVEAAKYKLMATITDKAGAAASAVISLNIK
jgi:hypothetical protein